jgi:hypothetical protein
MRNLRIEVILYGGSAVGITGQSNSTVDLLSDGDLFGYRVLVMSSISIKAFVANVNIWISAGLCLTNQKGII